MLTLFQQQTPERKPLPINLLDPKEILMSHTTSCLQEEYVMDLVRKLPKIINLKSKVEIQVLMIQRMTLLLIRPNIAALMPNNFG
jgi:hypothetical protein